MRRAWVLVLWAAACGTSPPPRTASNEPPSVTVPDASPPPPPAKPTPAPSAIVMPVTLNENEALVPDDACFDGPRHFLGYRVMPEAEIEAGYFLVGEDSACKVSTRARAKIMLAKAESREQVATCGGWRVDNCTNTHVHAAVPAPPFHEVSTFGYGRFYFQSLDEQREGLGEPRASYYDERVAGSDMTVRHIRGGYVVVRGSEKDLDAFWAKAEIQVDGQPYIVTADTLVRLTQPLEQLTLPSLHASDRAPRRKPHPWEREN